MTTHAADATTSFLPVSVHLAALGTWSSLPEVNTPFDLSLEPVSSSWREDLISQGWDNGVFVKSTLKRLRVQPHVIFAELSFQPYLDVSLPTFPSVQLRWASAAAKLFKHLVSQGAEALYFDGALKAFTPEMIEEVNPKDSATLFHLFVEIWGDQDRVATEGMSIFGLPDVIVTGLNPQSPEAQATVFSAAAQMVCDDLRLPNQEYFRASESFPWCSAQWIKDPIEASRLLGESISDDQLPDAMSTTSEVSSEGVEDQPLLSSCGICHLTPVDRDVGESLSRAWLNQLDDSNM
jgi:hypothetical protein